MSTPDVPTENSESPEVVGMVSVNRPHAEAEAPRTRGATTALIVAAVTAIALIGGIVAGMARLGSLAERLETVEEQTDANTGDIDDLMSAYQSLSSGSTPARVPEGNLPTFDPTLASDPAVGMVLGPVSVTSYPEGVQTVIDPADGRPRVWLVWAHWCPHCQAELPALAGVFDQIAVSTVDLVTISTNQDPARGNPQDEYLATAEFPFPVYIDSGNAAAGQMGVVSFPSWMITNGDGAVVSRWSGEIGAESMVRLFDDLDEYFAEAS
jgi:thiol-disulfide isomerase/thioredoxin